MMVSSSSIDCRHSIRYLGTDWHGGHVSDLSKNFCSVRTHSLWDTNHRRNRISHLTRVPMYQRIEKTTNSAGGSVPTAPGARIQHPYHLLSCSRWELGIIRTHVHCCCPVERTRIPQLFGATDRTIHVRRAGLATSACPEIFGGRGFCCRAFSRNLERAYTENVAMLHYCLLCARTNMCTQQLMPSVKRSACAVSSPTSAHNLAAHQPSDKTKRSTYHTYATYKHT